MCPVAPTTSLFESTNTMAAKAADLHLLDKLVWRGYDTPCDRTKLHNSSPFAHSVFLIRDLYCGYSVINRLITSASFQ